MSQQRDGNHEEAEKNGKKSWQLALHRTPLERKILGSPNPVHSEKQLQEIDFTRPEKTTHGHFVSNNLFAGSKPVGLSPRSILSQICSNMENIHSRERTKGSPIKPLVIGRGDNEYSEDLSRHSWEDSRQIRTRAHPMPVELPNRADSRR